MSEIKLKQANGRSVTGEAFFNRSNEMQILQERIENGSHVLLSGQRRMGKSSIARQLGSRLQAKGWATIFVDIEGMESAEEVISEIAAEAFALHSVTKKWANKFSNLLPSVDNISMGDYKVSFRAGLNKQSWKSKGSELLADYAAYEKPVYLVIDELPIFLTRLLKNEEGVVQVDAFMSWLRSALQKQISGDLVVLVSGSIGLEPLMKRLGLPDRINHLDPFRLGPWNEQTSIACLTALAKNYDNVTFEPGVFAQIYQLLGIGIPHHVQSFFSRLREQAMMSGELHITVAQVKQSYQHQMLGPNGQRDLEHYVARLAEGLDDDSYKLALEILTEAAIEDHFTPAAYQTLLQIYQPLISEPGEKVEAALDILQHDGYLQQQPEQPGHYGFVSKLLKDWWQTRYQNTYQPLDQRKTPS